LPKLATKNFSDNKEIHTFLQVKKEKHQLYIYILMTLPNSYAS